MELLGIGIAVIEIISWFFLKRFFQRKQSGWKKLKQGHRETETERDRERDRERQRERQRESERDRDRDRDREKREKRETERDRERQRDMSFFAFPEIRTANIYCLWEVSSAFYLQLFSMLGHSIIFFEK